MPLRDLSSCTNLFGPASHYEKSVLNATIIAVCWDARRAVESYTDLGENVVKEKEYLSAILPVYLVLCGGRIEGRKVWRTVDSEWKIHKDGRLELFRRG
jgi:hypothetical protein